MRYWIDYDMFEKAVQDMCEEYKRTHPEKDSFDKIFNTAFELGVHNARCVARNMMLSIDSFKITSE